MKSSNLVIDRINHDNLLNQQQWIVGYKDRFEGIQERHFEEFNFKDTTADNFLPIHRIYYFKCNDDIVWDRRNMVDNIFGSTGGKKINQILEEQNK